jgi:hypothetical protein
MYLFVRHKEDIPNNSLCINTIFDDILFASPGVKAILFKDRYHQLKLFLI